MQTELDRETGARLLLSRTAFPGTIAAAYGAHFLLRMWSVPLSDQAPHEVEDGSGMGLFEVDPVPPGYSVLFTFPAAGT